MTLQYEPTVDCVGFVIVTEVTDNAGRTTCQHSPTYRSREEAERIAGTTRKLRSWERSITNTVEPCCTAFPLSAVLAGEAQRWEDWQAELADAAERIAA